VLIQDLILLNGCSGVWGLTRNVDDFNRYLFPAF